MEKTKILYFITRMDQGGAQASVLMTLKTLNKQQFEAYLASGPGGRLDGKVKNDAKNASMKLKDYIHFLGKEQWDDYIEFLKKELKHV